VGSDLADVSSLFDGQAYLRSLQPWDEEAMVETSPRTSTYFIVESSVLVD